MRNSQGARHSDIKLFTKVMEKLSVLVSGPLEMDDVWILSPQFDGEEVSPILGMGCELKSFHEFGKL